MADGDNRPSDHDVGGPSEACERFGCADSAERSGLPSKVAMVDFRGPNRERCVNYFTLAKMDAVPKIDSHRAINFLLHFRRVRRTAFWCLNRTAWPAAPLTLAHTR